MDVQLQERTFELSVLDGCLRDAAAGNGRLVFIGGEAGVGKSALVNQFCHDARGRARVLRGNCEILSTPRPLGPLLDIANITGGELDRLLCESAPREYVFRAALAELGNALTPSLTVIEDAHWADEATLDALRFFGRRLETARALLIVTYRNDEVGPTHPLRVLLGDLATNQLVRRIELDPLSLEGTRALVAAYDGGTHHDPDAIHGLTGGNPFFVSEILSINPLIAGQIPVTVRDAVLARASRLSADGRSAIEAAAVIGTSLTWDLINEVTGLPEAAIESCLNVGMLIAGRDGLAFRHEIARATMYEATSPLRRRTLHAAVLAALAAGPIESQDPSRLAHHAEAADDRHAALRYSLIAAETASALGATREAVAQYARARRFAADRSIEERLSILEAFADISDLAGSGSSGIATRQEMIDLARQAGNRDKEANHLGWLADSFALDGQYDRAREAANAAHTILADRPEGPIHAKIYYHHAHVCLLSGDVVGAIDWSNRCIDLATKLNDIQTVLLGLNTRGETRLTSGDDDQGRRDLERCAAIAREAGCDGFVAGALANLGSSLAETYQFADAEHSLAEAIAFASEREDDNWRYWAVAWQAQTRLFQGDLPAAMTLARSIVPLALSVGAPLANHSAAFDPNLGGKPVYIRIVALTVLGRILARRGESVQAAEYLAEARELVGSNRTFRQIAPIQAARAEAAWLDGDDERAIAEARFALDQTVGFRQAWLEGELASWLWRAGGLTVPPPNIATPYRLQIEGQWEAAAKTWEERGCPYEAALARFDGDERSVRAALATFNDLGAAVTAARASRKLRAIGARGIARGPRPGTRANAAGLTKRELDVLPLVAAGHQTEVIAARLFLSPRTVEHHIGHILAKLDVRTRHDVAAAASRYGLLGTASPS